MHRGRAKGLRSCARSPAAVPSAAPVGWRGALCRPSSMPRSIDRFEVRDDLLAMRLEKRRQDHLFTERCEIFVDAESRAVGGDLEEHAVRFAHIQAAEPEPI